MQDALTIADELLALDMEPEAAVTESTDVRIIEAAPGDKTGRQWDVVLITAGQSLNGRTYPVATLKKATPLFEGVFAYADHQGNDERASGRDRSIRDKVGRFSDAKFGRWTVDGVVTEGIRARFRVMAPWLREVLVEAVEAGDSDFLGFSIDAQGEVVKGVVKTIEKVRSVDVVSNPAAGGRIERLVAAGNERETPMKCTHCTATFETQEALVEHLTEALAPPPVEVPAPDTRVLDEIRAARAELAQANARARLTEGLSAATVTDISKGQLRKRFSALIEAGVAWTDEGLTEAITESSEHEAALAAQFAAPPVFSTTRVEAGANRADNQRKRMELMFDMKSIGFTVDGVRPYSGLMESYCDWHGTNPYETEATAVAGALFVKYDSKSDHKRIMESLTTASWGQVYADVIYNGLLSHYRTAPYYNEWRRFVSTVENVPDFRTRHYTRIGGYGDLGTVAEGATYPMLTSPGDEEVTYTIAKHGGLDDVTMEAIVNDHIGAIRQIPKKMADAADRTLYKFVMNMITTDNAVLDFDSVALYDSAHANTGTTALTLAGMAATEALMRTQGPFNVTGEVLGPRNMIKHLIVPNELAALAERIVNPSGTYNMSPTGDTDGSVDPETYKRRSLDVTVYDYLTDVNNWYAVADPNQVETMVLGFFGSQEPELFTQDNPLVGSVFTADKITYKVRFIYGGDVVDYRPFFRQVVA